MTTDPAPLAADAPTFDAPTFDEAPALDGPAFGAPPDAAGGDGGAHSPAFAPAPDPVLAAATMHLLSEVELEVTVELGRCRLPLGEVARLGAGSVVELDTLAGEPLIVYVNGRRIATGEAVVVDGQFGVRITHLEPTGTSAA